MEKERALYWWHNSPLSLLPICHCCCKDRELYESADGARQALLLLVLLMFLVLDDAGPTSEAAETQSK
jgi:hypothetical protein